jgi:hypothetical protein
VGVGTSGPPVAPVAPSPWVPAVEPVSCEACTPLIDQASLSSGENATATAPSANTAVASASLLTSCVVTRAARLRS